MQSRLWRSTPADLPAICGQSVGLLYPEQTPALQHHLNVRHWDYTGKPNKDTDVIDQAGHAMYVCVPCISGPRQHEQLEAPVKA